MSEPKISATELDMQAADWLQRQNFWNWSESDQAELDAWLAESRAHRVAYWRQKAVWSNAQRLTALRSSIEMPAQSNAPNLSFFRTIPNAFRIAAVVGVVAVAGVIAAKFILKPQERVYSTPVGGHETIAFADGTKIELNTNTVLRARMTTESRTIWLERGEAFFQVRHDAAHPFTVVAQGHRITDLGTKFAVRQGVSSLEVTLLEGKIRFAGEKRSAVLMPGETAIATGNSFSVTKEPAQSLSDQLSWRRGVLVFKYQTLADVAAEFNRYNSKKIIIADPGAGNLMIFGKFRTQDVDLFTRVTQKALGLNVRDEGDQILISR